MNKEQLKSIIEALLFMSTDPLSLQDIKKILQAEPLVEPSGEPPVAESAPSQDAVDQLAARQNALEEEVSSGEIRGALQEIMEAINQDVSRGIELVCVDRAYQLRTRQLVAPFVKKLYKMPKPRLSSPGMETLAIIAYQQPINRARIEEIRGVDTGGVLKTLLDRDLIRIVGRSEEAGRPILYGTASAFLETFSLTTLSDLPTLKDLESLDESAPATEVSEMSENDPLLAGAPEISEDILDEESGVLLGELENSMRSLKELEQQTFEKPDEPDV